MSADATPVPLHVQAPPAAPGGRHPDDGWVLAAPHPLPGPARKALRGLVRAVCPPPPAPWSDALEDAVSHAVQVHLRYLPPASAAGLVLAFLALDRLPALSRARRPLHQLERGDAARWLEGASHLPFNASAMIMLGVRGLILAAYFDQDAVHQAMGCGPMEHLGQRVALRRRLLEGEAARPEDHLGPFSEVAR